MAATTTKKCYKDDDCLNGGKCHVSSNANDFLQPLPSGKSGSCNCPSAFAGPLCELRQPGSSRDGPRDAASSRDHSTCTVDDDCLNGGMCLVTSTGNRNEDRHDFLQPPKVETYCFCGTGYIGRFCEIRDYNSPNYPISQESLNEALLSPGSIVGIVVGGFTLIATFLYLVVRRNTVTGHHDGLVKHTGSVTHHKGGIFDISRTTGLRQRKQKHQDHCSTVSESACSSGVQDSGPFPVLGQRQTVGVECPIA